MVVEVLNGLPSGSTRKKATSEKETAKRGGEKRGK